MFTPRQLGFGEVVVNGMHSLQTIDLTNLRDELLELKLSSSVPSVSFQLENENLGLACKREILIRKELSFKADLSTDRTCVKAFLLLQSRKMALYGAKKKILKIPGHGQASIHKLTRWRFTTISGTLTGWRFIQVNPISFGRVVPRARFLCRCLRENILKLSIAQPCLFISP